MKHFIRVLVFMVLALAMASGQDLRFVPLDRDGRIEGFHVKWEPAYSRLLAYRDIDSPDMAAVRFVVKDGDGVGIYPLRDLPAAVYVDVWDVSATPEGGAVIATVVGYGPRLQNPGDLPRPKLKNMLLTYAADGKFVRAIETGAGTHTHRIAVDSKGNIYSLGDEDSDSPYPQLVKYSSSGSILDRPWGAGKGMPFCTLSGCAAPEANDDASGADDRMWINHDHLFVWESDFKGLLEFSPDGGPTKRVFYGEPIRNFALNVGFDRVDVVGVGTTRDGHIIVQCRFWPPDGSDKKLQIVMLRLSTKEYRIQQLGPSQDGFSDGEMMGMNDDDLLVFMNHDGVGGMILSQKPLPAEIATFAKK